MSLLSATQHVLKATDFCPLCNSNSPKLVRGMIQKYYRWVLGALLALMAAQGWAQSEKVAKDDAYLPLFVMYSGNPTEQQLHVRKSSRMRWKPSHRN